MSDKGSAICGEINSAIKRARCMILVQRCEEAPPGRIEIRSGDISIDAADSQSCVAAVAGHMSDGVVAQPEPQPEPQPQPPPLPTPPPVHQPLPPVSRPAYPAPASYGNGQLPPLPPLPGQEQGSSGYSESSGPAATGNQYPLSPAAWPNGPSSLQTIQSTQPLDTSSSAIYPAVPPGDGIRTLRKPFSAQLIVDGRVLRVQRKILVGDGKGFLVNVEYSATATDVPGRYRLSYTITGDAIAPMPLRTVDFSSTDGKTELSFEIATTETEGRMKVLSIGIAEGPAGSIG